MGRFGHENGPFWMLAGGVFSSIGAVLVGAVLVSVGRFRPSLGPFWQWAVLFGSLYDHTSKHQPTVIVFSRRRPTDETETRLLRMLNDVYDIADNHQSRSIVLQLDLSAAFDTLDKTTLLHRLDRTFGVRGTTYNWIESYLDGRSQFVSVGDRTSAPVLCEFDVPQGSVFGTLLFTIDTSPISNVIAQFKTVNHAQ